MANASYTAFRNGILTGGVYDLDTAVLKVALVGSYAFNLAHTSMADVTANGGVINGTPVALTNVTVVGGVLDADDSVLTTVASSNTHVLVIYQASAITGGADVTAANQKLMFYIDTGTNLPVTPGAGTVTITWPNTASKIYKLGA